MASSDFTLADLFRQFPDDETTQCWFEQQRWQGEPWCPHCGSFKVGPCTHKTMPYRCGEAGCRKRFSVRVGTTMQGSRLGYQTWAIAIFLLTTSPKGISSVKLARDLGITQKSAWHLAHRIRAGFAEKLGELAGEVEVDETYIGGKEKNKHSRKKLRAGRGTAGKLPVVGMRERSTERVVAQPIEKASAANLVPFVAKHTRPDVLLYADEHPAYPAVGRHLETVAHSRGEYVRDDVHTNGIESFWAELKRSYHGAYHWWSRKHLGRYVAESVWRHNHRAEGVLERIAAAVAGMVGPRLRYADLKGCSALRIAAFHQHRLESQIVKRPRELRVAPMHLAVIIQDVTEFGHEIYMSVGIA